MRVELQPPCGVALEAARGRNLGSVLIIVLWIAFGLVSLALYFADSMNFEMHAADNRAAGMSAEQAIEGAARYVNLLLNTQIAYGSNGFILDPTTYQNAAVPVGDAHFWLIGRDTNPPVGPGRLAFGLVDEASKLSLNQASSNQLIWLPRLLPTAAQAILDWRSTNGGATASYYSMLQPPYLCKGAPFETVAELRLVFGVNMDVMVGEDVNLNGVLDPGENDDNGNRMLDPGLLEYVTVYSREPNSSGAARVNISSLGSSSVGPLRSLLSTNFGTARANQILANLGLGGVAGGGGATGGGGTTSGRSGQGNGGRSSGTGGGAGGASMTVTFRSPLAFYVRSKMTALEFGQIFTNLAVTTNTFIDGRVNVNTASATVLACLLNGDLAAAQQLVSYRLANANVLTSIAWVADALGQGYSADLQALEAGDYITTQSYQFSADIAAVGPFGRGYRRVKFIFDTSSGTSQIIYRQDLSHLGWALGQDVRDQWVLRKGITS
ncbi:MAG: general secretion pathway protein GspK [Verrucomicrobia bacterium]|nr:general secretion pathway protein GspK [Verrucomicrobiota bacterium]